MLSSRRLFQQWSFALFLLCSPVPHFGRPIDALSDRMKRSVTHAQLMHDRGRTLQDLKRRMWLQELLDEVHTAEVRELPARGGGGGGNSSGGSSSGISTGISGSTLHPKPAGSTKNYPMGFPVDEEGTNLPQETNKSQTYKDQPLKVAGKKKKKGRSGKRRESEKRKRRARSLSNHQLEIGPHLEWRSHLRLQGALH
ncbi:parathyroid hormone-like hormone a [Paramormyrops kingsleyae]|uniref:Parathyroid hormone like hormone n=1 Tax=Paramormyrops kingsleyae TaxID=1676925 RepID=A0A3B3R9L1_9TELE|nr:parathyroid hormone-related protein-like [Paramormyrops kingsleyae]XP_023673619.1 parathyroid hormone-related protein-like [Paramormyrops kingsleyae]